MRGSRLPHPVSSGSPSTPTQSLALVTEMAARFLTSNPALAPLFAAVGAGEFCHGEQGTTDADDM